MERKANIMWTNPFNVLYCRDGFQLYGLTSSFLEFLLGPPKSMVKTLATLYIREHIWDDLHGQNGAETYLIMNLGIGVESVIFNGFSPHFYRILKPNLCRRMHTNVFLKITTHRLMVPKKPNCGARRIPTKNNQESSSENKGCIIMNNSYVQGIPRVHSF